MKIDCLNKHIVLVGNSVDSLTKKQGRDIDSFDLVVRFGKGVPTGKEKFIGSRTDIWATGSLRSKMRNQYPEETKVLYNPSFFEKKISHPNYEHTVMFTPDELENIHSKHINTYTPNSEKRKRLSIGLLTALYFCTKVNTFSSLTFINFDFFHKGVKFINGKTNKGTTATSWHLPLVLSPFEDPEDKLENHPAHEPSIEQNIVKGLLETRDDVFFIGDLNPTYSYENISELSWDKYRKPIN